MRDEEIEEYGDRYIATANAVVPRWLLLTYLLLSIWGFLWFALYWNGTIGWLDRGYWLELERAANTTFPIENANMKEEIKKYLKMNNLSERSGVHHDR